MISFSVKGRLFSLTENVLQSANKNHQNNVSKARASIKFYGVFFELCSVTNFKFRGEKWKKI